MNLVKFQNIKLIHRNYLHSYTLILKNQKDKETITFTITTKKNKIIRNKSMPKEFSQYS